MISIVGNALLIAALIASSGSMLFRGKSKLVCFYFGASTPLAAFILLIIAFVVSDFSIKNVFLNSSSLLPVIYKISAGWSSHEGSMLLFVALLSLMGAIYIKFTKLANNLQEFAIMILAFIQILFITFIIFTSNPFEAFSFVPRQGMGLNPMLQDTALSIHPPLLYLGSVTYIVLFVSGCLLLHKPEDSAIIFRSAKKFSSFALMTLSAGIGLGSWWAYRELGWGGFWFFDPVENISLLPWLSGIALHHFLIISARSRLFMRWTISLSLLSFLLTLYGTFMVRSGIISSVHSFAFSPERGLYIFSICATITLLCFIWFVIRNKYLPLYCKAPQIYERMILIGNNLWIAALISLIIALIYPIYCSFVLDVEIAIDPEYFTSVFIPIFIPILLLAALAPMIKQKLYARNIALLTLSTILAYIMSHWVPLGTITTCVSIAAIYLLLQTLSLLITLPESYNKYSLFLGHFGFGLLALSIVINSSLSKEINFIGQIGETVTSQEMIIKLDDIKFTDGINYYRQVAMFNLTDKSGKTVTLKPENRLYKIENTLSQEVDIYSFLFYDLYAVLNKINKKTIHAKIYYQPWISFIWLSILIISSGFLMLLLGRTRTN